MEQPNGNPRGGIVLRGLGTRFPSITNYEDFPIRITFEVAMTEEMRSVDIMPREVFPFHAHDGKFRADFIERIYPYELEG